MSKEPERDDLEELRTEVYADSVAREAYENVLRREAWEQGFEAGLGHANAVIAWQMTGSDEPQKPENPFGNYMDRARHAVATSAYQEAGGKGNPPVEWLQRWYASEENGGGL